MRQHDDVTASIVIQAGESGSERLVAYVLKSDGSAGTAEWLRPYLQSRLPEFMIPAHLVALARFPLTSSGKIDPETLPDPEAIKATAENAFVAPRTATEQAVAAIFSDLLFVERVGVDDDFFEIGGHSLLATRLLSRLRSTFRVDVSLRSVFESATPEGLSAIVDKKLAARAQS